jgi:DNA-binding response OmpR family regulator
MTESGISPTAGSRIAFVEDEDDIAELVTASLKREGYSVERFATGKSFLRSLEKRTPDLVLLDLMLPDANGVDLCRYLREHDKTRTIPVIMATAKNGEPDRVLGLELGADDYLVKPFSLRELSARIRAVLRRSKEAPASGAIQVGDELVLDPERHEVRVRGRTVDLTSTEFKVLRMLASRPGRVFSRDEILDHLWGHDKIVLDRTVDVHIKNLREKLGLAAHLVKNVRGAGYKVEP